MSTSLRAGQYPEPDARLIERAYAFAAYWHRGQTRRQPIRHPTSLPLRSRAWSSRRHRWTSRRDERVAGTAAK